MAGKDAVLARLTEADVQRIYAGLGVERFGSGGDGHWRVRSPFRDDRHPSLSIRKVDGVWSDKATGEGGSIFDAIMKRRGGTFTDALEEVARLVGLAGSTVGTREQAATAPVVTEQPEQPEQPEEPREKRRPVLPRAIYPYHDENGELLYEVVRVEEEGKKKRFMARRPARQDEESRKGWVWSLGNGRRVLYRLPEILAAEPWEWIFVVEGEKDADRLRQHGLVATTNAFGAGSWEASFAESLANRAVVVLADNDEAGRQHAEAVVASLRGVAHSVRVPKLLGVPPGGDISDWLDAGGDISTLGRLVELTSCEPRDVPPSAGPATDTAAAEGNEALKPASRARVRRMSEVPPQDVHWLWQDWLPLGKLTLMGGHVGAGKSTLAAGFAALLSRGLPWPGDEERAAAAGELGPAHSIFLLGEDAADDTLRPRLDQLGANPNYVLTLDAIVDDDGRERMFTLRNHLEELEAAIVEYEARLVVLDPLNSYMGSANSNDEGDVREVLTPLLRVAERAGCAVLGIGHVGKPSAGGRRMPQQMLLGSTAFIAVARSIMMTAKIPETERNVLASVKSNLSRFPAPLEWSRPDNGPLIWHGPATHSIDAILGGIPGTLRPEPREDAEDLLRVLLADGPVASREVEAAASELGISEFSIKRARKELGVQTRRLGGSNGGWYLMLEDADWDDFVAGQSTPSSEQDDGLTLPSSPDPIPATSREDA
ncbi:MAG TPA: AAA family ATPase [Thermomicrobiales bacterium]|nr:AAA family ATPase [Thermomicrobiales bacterium]